MQPYYAKGPLRNGHTNSILGSLGARKALVLRRARIFLKQSAEEIISAGGDVRLSVQVTRHTNPNAPNVILFHGWLGCADSLYLISLGKFLYDQGFHVFRLNFRDHGNSHHLNEELFHSCRIQEVIDACITIQKKYAAKPVSLVGFSLGGNFALRVNAFTSPQQLEIAKTVAFCPVIDPMHTLLSLENSLFIYRDYFMQRWKHSFYEKVAAFPHLYSKSTFKNFQGLRDATDNLATQYAGFKSLDAYLNGYSITGERLNTLHAPAQIVLSKDDPIIPWRDHHKLTQNPLLKVDLCKHGGHCGFLEPSLLSPWVDCYTRTQLSNTSLSDTHISR